jgi:hypothetical protein
MQIRTRIYSSIIPFESFLSFAHSFICPSFAANAPSAPQQISHQPSPIIYLQTNSNSQLPIARSLSRSLKSRSFASSITPMPPKHKNQKTHRQKKVTKQHQIICYNARSSPLQNLLQNPLLFCRQSRRELDVILDDEITPRIRLLTYRHPEIWVRV